MITKDKHHKHPPLIRRILGNYHHSEWAWYGTNCGAITEMVDTVRARLEGHRIGYIDADHSNDISGTKLQVGKKQFYTDIGGEWNHFDDRLEAIDCDAVFVNGNHYSATRQIIIIDEAKEASLLRRVEQLTDIDMVIVDDESQIFPFVKEAMTAQTKVYKAHQLDAIVGHIAEEVKNQIPVVKGLVLAGGKSQRMGKDKSQIDYHGKTQEQYMVQLLESINIETFLSKAHKVDSPTSQVITDRFVDMGPFGAIASAMMDDPNAAWLVVACDMPFVTKEVLQNLLDQRDASLTATAYRGADNPFPEPLIAIYEPRAYQRFLSFLSLGYACPRKVLINSEIKEVILDDMQIIANVNTKEQLVEAQKKLGK